MCYGERANRRVESTDDLVYVRRCVVYPDAVLKDLSDKGNGTSRDFLGCYHRHKALFAGASVAPSDIEISTTIPARCDEKLIVTAVKCKSNGEGLRDAVGRAYAVVC